MANFASYEQLYSLTEAIASAISSGGGGSSSPVTVYEPSEEFYLDDLITYMINNGKQVAFLPYMQVSSGKVPKFQFGAFKQGNYVDNNNSLLQFKYGADTYGIMAYTTKKAMQFKNTWVQLYSTEIKSETSIEYTFVIAPGFVAFSGLTMYVEIRNNETNTSIGATTIKHSDIYKYMPMFNDTLSSQKYLTNSTLQKDITNLFLPISRTGMNTVKVTVNPQTNEITSINSVFIPLHYVPGLIYSTMAQKEFIDGEFFRNGYPHIEGILEGASTADSCVTVNSNGGQDYSAGMRTIYDFSYSNWVEEVEDDEGYIQTTLNSIKAEDLSIPYVHTAGEVYTYQNRIVIA